MSDPWDRSFTWVWRLNGLLILGLGLAGIAGAIALAFNVALFWVRDRPEQQLTRVAGADLDANDLRLSDFGPVAGTPFLYAALAPPSEYIGSGSSGGLGEARNLLFFDTNSKKAHWLLPDNEQIIRSFSFLMDPPGPRHAWGDSEARERDPVVIAILLELEPSRSATEGRSRTLAVSSADGRGMTEIARSTGGMLGHHHPRTDTAFVFYVSDGAARVLDVDPTTRKVRSDSLLSTRD